MTRRISESPKREANRYPTTLFSSPPIFDLQRYQPQFVKLDSRETPPPLHYSPTPSDPDKTSSFGPTPISTPKIFSRALPEKSERGRDILFPWHQKVINNSVLLDSDLEEESTFPLFGESPPWREMAGGSSPINIATQSRNSAPLRFQQTSNLSSALQSTTGNELRSSYMLNANNGNGKYLGGSRQDTLSGTPGLSAHHGSGAQPISMSGSNRGHPRRESGAGSIMGGMSWGGVSVGSWIRDDIIMQGTSPFGYQSPSFHSSSYLPKLEANFMRDFTCCGRILPSLHDLLQHYEESHAQQISSASTIGQQTHQLDEVSGKKPVQPTNAPEIVNQQTQQQISQQQNSTGIGGRSSVTQTTTNNLGISSKNQQRQHFETGKPMQIAVQPVQDIDDVGDMEMDDIPGIFSDMNSTNLQHSQFQPQDSSRFRPRSHFGQTTSARVPPLDLNALNLGNPLQAHQVLRNSQPTTPISGGRPSTMYPNNPCVSSVNTPTLTTYPLQQQQYRNTPDSSAPGTPKELDPDFSGTMDTVSMNTNQQFMQGNLQSFGGYGYGNGNDMLDLCIDEPAKRLFSPGGLNDSGSSSNNRLGRAQYGPNSEIALRIREQQRRVGLADTVSGLNGEEPKPFRCPVIGCEKAYKNQNGLKYHKSHGHNNQQLHENLDGTFSIVDPATSTPYPGTLGMEKEKPYKCETCGKRYKNLNGLKYHKSHAPPCNPDLKLTMGIHEPINVDGMNVNIAGVGLAGIGEEMVL